MPVNFANYPGGYAGTRFTIEKMRQLARKGKVDPYIIKVARTIIRNCEEKNYDAEGECIYDYVRANVRYTRDPRHVELVQGAKFTLQNGAGDCDDSSVAMAALAEAVGMEAAFVTIKGSRRTPGDFTHVFTIIKTQKGWRGADVTVAEAYFGWIPPEATQPSKRRIWTV